MSKTRAKPLWWSWKIHPGCAPRVRRIASRGQRRLIGHDVVVTIAARGLGQ